MTQSILVIGATGKSGIALLKHLSEHPTRPSVHAFCRDPRKLTQVVDKSYYKTVVKGNARDPRDLQKALEITKADIVIVSVGNGMDLSKNDIRTANAQALVQVLEQPQFEHVQVAVVSSNGAGGSKIIVGFGIGKLIEHHLRHVLNDHTGQETAFLETMSDRTLIVRATALVDDKPTGLIKTYADNQKGPTIETDRADMADFISRAVCGSPQEIGGKVFNITSVKAQ